MTASPKLTDNQLVLLSSAAQGHDQLVVMPERLKGGAAKATVSKLLSLALVEELPVRAGEAHWRKNESQDPIALKLTRAGLLAIGIEPDDAAVEQEAEAKRPAASARPRREPVQSDDGSERTADWVPREGSKQELVLNLLSRPEGATIDDLLSATGWLPHTTRAALTGLRHKGYAFLKSKNEAGETVYRTATPADAPGQPAAMKANTRHGMKDPKATAADGKAA